MNCPLHKDQEMIPIDYSRALEIVSGIGVYHDFLKFYLCSHYVCVGSVWAFNRITGVSEQYWPGLKQGHIFNRGRRMR